MAEWTEHRPVTADSEGRRARQLRVKLNATVRAFNDMAVFVSEHHQPITAETLMGMADVCSCCHDDDGRPVLYPCRTMRLVREYQTHVVRVTDGRRVTQDG